MRPLAPRELIAISRSRGGGRRCFWNARLCQYREPFVHKKKTGKTSPKPTSPKPFVIVRPTSPKATEKAFGVDAERSRHIDELIAKAVS